MNYNLIKFKTLLALASGFFLIAGLLAGTRLIQNSQELQSSAAASTNLSISPQNLNVYPGEDMSFSVQMDTGSNNVTGVDIYLNFDPKVLQIVSIDKGSGILNFDNTIENSYDNTTGSTTFSAFTIDKRKFVSGSIDVLKILAKVANNAPTGASLVTFNPETAIAASSETHSVLLGTTPGSFNILILPTASPKPTASPAPQQGEPNSCGGTCGSNYNCQSGLFCNQGFCRNPSCASSTNCNCPTATPTVTPTAKPTPSPNNIVYYVEPTYSPNPVKVTSTPTVDKYKDNFWQEVNSNSSSEEIPLASFTPTNLPQSSGTNLMPWIIGSLTIAGIVTLIFAIKFYKSSGLRRNRPPIIKL